MSTDQDHAMPESRFYMWRAVFALAHADDVVTAEERRFMYKALNQEKFSPEQVAILQKDMEEPQDIGKMFVKISDQADRTRFFDYARLMFWCDGDFDEQEQAIMTALGRAQFRMVDVEEMLKDKSLELEDSDKDEWLFDELDDWAEEAGGVIKRFFRRFRS